MKDPCEALHLDHGESGNIWKGLSGAEKGSWQAKQHDGPSVASRGLDVENYQPGVIEKLSHGAAFYLLTN
jgi:hypothetical protein